MLIGAISSLHSGAGIKSEMRSLLVLKTMSGLGLLLCEVVFIYVDVIFQARRLPPLGGVPSVS